MTTAAEIKHIQDHGLYSPAHEHDACGRSEERRVGKEC